MLSANHQPSAIGLGMHNIVERPVAVDGKVEIRPIMYIALTITELLMVESLQVPCRGKNVEDPTTHLLTGDIKKSLGL